MDKSVVSIYISGDVADGLDPDLLAAIHEMQANFGLDGLYDVPFNKIRAHIAKSHGVGVAKMAKAQMFLPALQSA